MPFDTKIALLSLKETEEGVYTWVETGRLWAEAKLTGKATIFSKVGLSAQAVQFTLNRRALSLHDAILWEGRHCFLVSVIPKGSVYLEVTAAPVTPVTCRLKREAVIGRNELNNPIMGELTSLTFPGCLTEKYLGYERGKAEAVSIIAYVLVTPKAISLTVGDLVSIGEEAYEVRITHTSDEYKNEYEVYRKKDVQACRV